MVVVNLVVPVDVVVNLVVVIAVVVDEAFNAVAVDIVRFAAGVVNFVVVVAVDDVRFADVVVNIVLVAVVAKAGI